MRLRWSCECITDGGVRDERSKVFPHIGGGYGYRDIRFLGDIPSNDGEGVDTLTITTTAYSPGKNTAWAAMLGPMSTIKPTGSPPLQECRLLFHPHRNEHVCSLGSLLEAGKDLCSGESLGCRLSRALATVRRGSSMPCRTISDTGGGGCLRDGN